MSNPRYHNGHRRREVQAYYRARRADCYICGRPIDYSLRPPDPWSFVVDETVAIANGGRVCRANSGPARGRLSKARRLGHGVWEFNQAELIDVRDRA